MLNAQEGNLVPNPSFEEYLTCPQSTGELQIQVIDWFSWQESPDFFHVCNNDGLGTAGVPDNALGNQLPVHGDGYAGLFTFVDPFPNGREYITAELLEPLTTGEDYYLMFYVSPHDGGSIEDRLCYSNNIGLRFFKNPPYQTTPPSNIFTPDNFAHLNSTQIIDNTEEWLLLEGWFTADDDYNWIGIGNFFDDVNTQTLQDNENGLCWCHFFIDNVCVATDPNECDYLLSIAKETQMENIIVYPNPASSILNIGGYRGMVDLSIFSMDGQLVLSKNQVSSSNSVNIETLPKGVYMVSISNDHLKSEHVIIKQ